MAIIDSLKKISDTVWELPATYKEGMRVPSRIIATEKLVRQMEEVVYGRLATSRRLPALRGTRSCMPDAT
jgi:tRNA-splicing ligase RtcB